MSQSDAAPPSDPAPQADPARRRRRRRSRRIAGAAVILALLLGLPTAAYLGLQTTSGRRALVRVVERAVSSPNLGVDLGRLTGSVPFGMRLDRLTVADRDGVWLSGSGIRLDIRPADVLRGRLHITDLGADVLRVDRAPATADAPDKGSRPIRLPELPDAARRVRVDRLHVGRLELGEAIHPEAPAFSIRGEVEPVERSGIRATLQLAALAGPETSGVASAVLAGSPSTLELSVSYDEAGAGLLGRALRLPGDRPLRVHLVMDGPLERWQGHVRAECGSDAIFQGEQTFSVRDDRIDADLHARFTPGVAMFPDSLEPALAGGGDLALRVSVVDGQRIEIAELRATTPTLELAASGQADFNTQRVDLDTRLSAPTLADLAPDKGVAGSTHVEARIAGALPRPSASVEFSIAGLSMAGSTVAQADGALEVAWESDASGSPIAVARGTGSLRGAAGKGLPEALRQDLTWRLDTGYAEEVLTVREFALAADRELARASVRADFAAPRVVFDGTASAPDIAAWRVPALSDASGRLRVAFSGSHDADEVLRVSIEAEGEDLAGLPATAQTALASGFHARGMVAVPLAGPITVEGGEATADAFSATLRGTYTRETREVVFEWTAAIPELARLEAAIGRPMQGALEAKGTAAGPVDAFRFDADIAATRLHVAGLTNASGEARVDVAGLPGAPTGSVVSALRMSGETARVTARFESDASAVRLPSLQVDAPGLTGSGGLTADTATRLVTGDIALTADDLSRIGSWMGVDLAGTLDADLTADAEGGVQTVALDGSLSDLRVGSTTIAGTTVSVRATDPAHAVRAQLSLAASDIDLGATQVTGLTLAGELTDGAIDFALDAKGAAGGRAFGGAARGNAEWSGGAGSGRITSLDAEWGGTPVSLDSGGAFGFRPDGVVVDPLTLALGDGGLAFHARVDGDSVDGLLQLDEVPLSLAAPAVGMPLDGRAEGRIALSGLVDAPRVDVELHAREVSGVRGAGRLGPLTAQLNATLAGGALDARAEILGLFDEPVTAEGRAPVAFSLRPTGFRVEPTAPLTGRAHFRGDLSTLAELIVLDGQELQGALAGDLQLGGALSQPRLTGSLTIQNGLYQHFLHGVVMRDIHAELRGDGNRLELTSLEATDGGQGSVKGNGSITLDLAERFPYDITFRLTRATLLRHDERTATLDGDVRLTGNLAGGEVVGALTVGPAEALIPTRPPTRMRDVDVVAARNDNGADDDAHIAPPIPNFRERLRLGLDVSMPDRVFVRGMGLDSEWKGRLRVAGTLARPAVTGSLASVRGTIDFLGRMFVLQEGEVSLGGQFPPAPILQVAASTRVEDIEALIMLSGPTDQPRLELTSSPTLPEDEILARVLFGRNLSRVTPLQAIQLARAAEALRSGGGAPSVMEQTRKALALDDIDFAQQEGVEGGSIGVGKYLTDDIYLRVEQGIGVDSTRMQVNVEFSPTLSLETSTDSDAKSEIKLRWKRDY